MVIAAPFVVEQAVTSTCILVDEVVEPFVGAVDGVAGTPASTIAEDIDESA